MDQELLKPAVNPPVRSQAFSPLGCALAAIGMTLLVFTKSGAAMVAAVWAISKLIGLPDMVMYAIMAAGFVPVVWVSIWTAGRAWHVERRLANQQDVDVPVFKLGHYLKKA